ncbi:MAG: xanthine dehydrogenase family protein molybdopterin-binding subunit [Alphaproteobacteria bacterium]|nr:xanthine dehydrogenase family protein molybdopterin-binding subunit [Alphaproteobacteria bacterium]
MGKFGFGQPIRRKEDQRFLTGEGRYVADLNLPRQVHLHILRSPHAHARLGAPDTTRARAAPGVVAVFTGADVAAAGLGGIPCLGGVTNIDGTPSVCPPFPLLATDRVRHVGDAVAAVVAETPDQARDAAELIACDYQPLQAIVDTAGALRPDAPQVWPEAPGNLCYHWQGGDRAATGAAFAKAAHVTRIDLVNNRVVVGAMEPRGALAAYDAGTRRTTLYTGNQGVHTHRAVIAGILGVAENALRVVTPDVGGGFGMKGMLYVDQALVPWIAKVVGRPVKWVSERSEAFLSDTQGRDNVSHVELALDPNAHFLGLRITTVANLGAYLSMFAPSVPIGGTPTLGGLYRTGAIHIEVKGVFTHTVPVDAYRGAGRPEASYALERVVDAAARDLDIDPAELRARNYIGPAAMPYRTPMGVTYDDGDFAGNLETALGRSGWKTFAAKREAAKARGKLAGLGVANYMEITGWVPGDTTRIRFDPSGTVTVIVGSISTGQGHETTYAHLLADKLGVPFDSVRVLEGDSDAIAELSSGNGGSHFLQIAGPSLHGAADRIIAKGRRVAGHLLEAGEHDIEFAEGVFRVAGTDRGRSIVEVAKACFSIDALPPGMEPGLDESFFYRREANAYPNGCHVCEVEVDPDTGNVAVLRYTIADDFGRILNPLLVGGQIHGGLAQGLGQALLEHTVYDPDSGQLLTGSFMDYTMPRADDMPAIDVTYNEIPCKGNPLGVKGCGEAGSIGACPAVINAIVDALAPLGVNHIDMPATPERVWRAMRTSNRPR